MGRQSFQRRDDLSPHLGRQMGIKGGGARTLMAQDLLNQTQGDSRFQQVSGVGMTQRRLFTIT